MSFASASPPDKPLIIRLGFAPDLQGLRPNQGHSPNYISGALPAGRSPASHRAAKPGRERPGFCAKPSGYLDMKL